MNIKCKVIKNEMSVDMHVSRYAKIVEELRLEVSFNFITTKYLAVILRGLAGYELIYITNEAVGRVGYYQLISGKFEKNNCFSKFSSNSLDFLG